MSIGKKNIVSPSIWLLVGTMVHTRTGGARFLQKKISKKNKKKFKKIKKLYRKILKKNLKNFKKKFQKNFKKSNSNIMGGFRRVQMGAMVCRYGGISRSVGMGGFIIYP
jgi:hypothetical protein